MITILVNVGATTHVAFSIVLLLLACGVTAAPTPTGKAQKYIGTKNLTFAGTTFAGEGNTLGTGGTVSVYCPVSVGFNTIYKDVYIASHNGHFIRKVVWNRATTTTLLGSTTGWEAGLVDSPNPNTARLKLPWGFIFRTFGTSKVFIFIGDRMNNRIT